MSKFVFLFSKLVQSQCSSCSSCIYSINFIYIVVLLVRMRINPNYFVFQEFVSLPGSHTEEGSIPFGNKTDKDVQEFGNILAILNFHYDPSFTCMKAFLHYPHPHPQGNKFLTSSTSNIHLPPQKLVTLFHYILILKLCQSC